MNVNDEVNIQMRLNNEYFSSRLNIKQPCTDMNLNNIMINADLQNNSIILSLQNNSDNEIALEEMQLKLASLTLDDYKTCIVIPEFPTELASGKEFSTFKNEGIIKSYLYSIFIDKYSCENCIFGFSSSHISKNYIKTVINKKSADIYAVFNFINHNLNAHENITLDHICYFVGNNYFQLLTDYGDYILSNNHISRINGYIKNTYYTDDTFLYTTSPVDCTLTLKNKHVHISAGKNKLYLVDISKDNGKKLVTDKLINMAGNGTYTVLLKNIKPYIKLITEIKSFNVYNELFKLFNTIRQTFPNLSFSFEDCPEGLALASFNILTGKVFASDDKSFLKKILNKDNKNIISYDFITKLLFENYIFEHNINFNIENNKIKQILKVITKDCCSSDITNEAFSKILYDIDSTKNAALFIKDVSSFSILRYGKSALYIAAFNLSDRTKRYFINFSGYIKNIHVGNLSENILTDEKYIVSNGTLYIGKIPDNDCCLIKIPLICDNNSPLPASGE